MNSKLHSQLPKSWMTKLQEEFNKPYFLKLLDFLTTELKSKKIIFPKMEHCFKAFEYCEFDQTKVVILGQDPYHGENQAHGLSFSVPEGVTQPPSLKNIFKELNADLNINESPNSGNLSAWAKQGVLLLNTTLTVEKSKPGSHQKQGWETFTDAVLLELSKDQRPKVFVLWGSSAQQKIKLLNPENHLILTAPHPSPLSSYRGFFGSRPFSKANEFLANTAQPTINWKLT